MSDTPFRTREAPVSPESAPHEAKPIELGNDGHEDEAVGREPEFTSATDLENWEIQNGKYGLEYFGIKEIGKAFPLNAQFGIIDKYIKAEITERGLKEHPESWQAILDEIEHEIKSQKLNPYERLKKISGFIGLMKRQKELNEKKKLYIN